MQDLILNFTLGEVKSDFGDNKTKFFSNESVYSDFAEINISIY